MLRVSSLRNKRCLLPDSVFHGLDLLADVDDVSQLIGDLTVVLSLPRHGTTKIHRTRRLKQKSDSGVRKCHFFTSREVCDKRHGLGMGWTVILVVPLGTF